MRYRESGLSLLELLISAAVSAVLIMALLQLQWQSSLTFDRQQQFSRQLENAASLQHLISHSVRDALYTVRSLHSPAAELMTEHGCAGVVLQQICTPPVIAWTVQTGAQTPVPGAAPGSSVLQLQQNCCAGALADQFYLSHRAGLESNPLSLYRRRLTSDGAYTPAVELVEGVDEFIVSFVVQNNDVGDLVHLGAEQVTDWWRLRAVRIHYRLADLRGPDGDGVSGSDGEAQTEQTSTAASFSFTIASRQWQQAE